MTGTVGRSERSVCHGFATFASGVAGLQSCQAGSAQIATLSMAMQFQREVGLPLIMHNAHDLRK